MIPIITLLAYRLLYISSFQHQQFPTKREQCNTYKDCSRNPFVSYLHWVSGHLNSFHSLSYILQSEWNQVSWSHSLLWRCRQLEQNDVSTIISKGSELSQLYKKLLLPNCLCSETFWEEECPLIVYTILSLWHKHTNANDLFLSKWRPCWEEARLLSIVYIILSPQDTKEIVETVQSLGYRLSIFYLSIK